MSKHFLPICISPHGKTQILHSKDIIRKYYQRERKETRMVLKIGLVLFIIGIILVIAGAAVTIKANKYELKIGGIKQMALARSLCLSA